MAKSTRKTSNAVTTLADRSSKLPKRSARVAESEIACHAYDLYRARGYKDGYDVHDWLQAERDLRKRRPSSAA